MSHLFGWSLPPGVSMRDIDPPERPCEVCGGLADSGCICPECTVCGSHGDPICYLFHGLERSEEQSLQFAYMEAIEEDTARAEAKWDFDNQGDDQ